jgi:hypothetical protein
MPDTDRLKAEALRLRADRLRQLSHKASCSAVAGSLRRLAEMLERLARKFAARQD